MKRRVERVKRTGLTPVPPPARGWLCLAAALVSLVVTVRADSLQNGFLRADFGSSGLTNVTDLTTGKSLQFNQDGFYVSVGSDTFLSSSYTPALVRQTATNRVYQFTHGQWT